MPDPMWSSSPPEVNHLRLVGPGAAGTATTLASGAAWQALMGSTELAFSLSSLNTATTALDFEGVGGMSSTAAVTGLNTALQLLAGWVQEKPPIAASAVAAYEAAVSAMIPAEVSIANRVEQAADVAINPLVLGALTPSIVALDAEYFGEHWPHNASTGVAYGATLTALVTALAVPPPLSPLGASPAAPAAAAAAVAEAAGQAAAGEAMKESAQASEIAGNGTTAPAQAAASIMGQPLQAAMQPAMGMFQTPVQALGGLSGLAQSMVGALGGTLGANSLGDAEFPAATLLGAGTSLAGLGGGGAGVGASTSAAGSGALPGSIPGVGLTSYTRPSSSFAPENSGRPAALRADLMSVAELRGPTTTGITGSAVPVAPGHSGGTGQSRASADKDGVVHARVVVGTGQPRENRRS